MPHILTDVKEIQRLIKEGKIIHRQGSGDYQTTRHARESDMIPIEWCLSVGHRFELIPGSLIHFNDPPNSAIDGAPENRG